MMYRFIQEMKSAIGRLEVWFSGGLESRGTCFLVSDRQIITCAHLVLKGGETDVHVQQKNVVAHFGTLKISAYLSPGAFNTKEDWAILILEKRLNITPLTLCNSISQGKDWMTFGYPDYSPVDGVTCSGFISDPIATIGDCWAIQLYSREAATQAPINGISGAPCVVGDKVVGVIRSAIIDAGTDRPTSGVVYASPISSITNVCGAILPPVSEVEDAVVAAYLKGVDDLSQKQTYISIYNFKPDKANSEVYVNLRAKKIGGPNEALQQKGEKTLPASVGEVTPSEMIATSKSSHIFVVGEAGAGKSTLLRHIANFAWNDPQKVGLSVKHVPVIVRLAALSEFTGSLLERISHAVYHDLPIAGPPNLLQHILSETGMPFIFLFDALDEVPQRNQARLLQWIETLIALHQPSKIMITSRPTAARSLDLRRWNCVEYEILPFSPQQTEEFAERWFGDRKIEFLSKYEALCPPDIHGTPLLLTISAKVFYMNGDLPSSRTKLYGFFINAWLEEAVLRDLGKEFENQNIVELAPLILGKIAYRATENNEVLDTYGWEEITAEAISNFCGVPQHFAEVEGRKFLRVMGYRSGVFSASGNVFEFAHPTFREYLAASYLIRRQNKDLESSLHLLFDITSTHVWREVTIFAAGLLSERNYNLSTYAMQFLTECKKQLTEADYLDDIEEVHHNIWMIYQIIRDGAIVGEEVIDYVIQLMPAVIDEMHSNDIFTIYAGSAYDPMEVLTTFAHKPAAKSALLSYFRRDDIDSLSLRLSATKYLIRIGLGHKDLTQILQWAFGTKIFCPLLDTETNNRVRMDLGDIFKDCGVPLLRHMIYNKTLHDIIQGEVEDAAIIPHILNKCLTSQEYSYEKDISPLKNLLLVSDDFIKVENGANLREHFGRSFEEVFINIIEDRDLVITDLMQNFLQRTDLSKMESLKKKLEALASDKAVDDWKRVHYALYLADFFGSNAALKKILSTEGADSDEPLDGYAFHYARSQWHQRQGERRRGP